MVRVPSSRGLSTRIEVRSVDPAANPYMALAAILQAGLDGIKNKTEVPKPVNQNIYEMNREEREAVGIHDLPSTLYTALKAMRENPTIKKHWVTIFTINLLILNQLNGIITEPKFLNGSATNT